MNLKLFTILLFCLIAVSKSAEEEYDYEEEAAPAPVTPAPAKPASRLGGLLAARNRPLPGKKTTQLTSTTAKAIEHPVDEDVEGDEGAEEKQEEEVHVTTTEASKKLKGGVVRPFRSNEDLLAALKRRRAQVGSSHSKDHSSTHSPAEATSSASKFKSASSGSRRNSGNAEATSKPTSRGRFGSTRGSKPVQEDVEETQHDEVQVKPKSFRRG
ncbi:uncharacterized protein LOC127282940 [Leptopilina boulardi]|uniref:uncharacterized protein LOC127282940 n=1 Tax=Leptopilina boulardi TaxID=63433 RepID=UPI0021F53184|nr:uncharacterized protein LOC127282940 [Leptopilina boulardi]